jgi:hypothetical protein
MAALTVLFSKWKKSVTEEENPTKAIVIPQKANYK